MMNTMTYSSEASGYHKKTNVTIVFYSLTHDVETSLRKGMNAIFTLAEIGQGFAKNQ